MIRAVALGLTLCFALLAGCKDEVRVKLRVRTADAGVKTASTSVPR